MDKVYVGSVLRKQRKRKRYSLQGLSAASGISKGFLSDLENNLKQPAAGTVFCLCRILSITPNVLLGWKRKSGEYHKQMEHAQDAAHVVIEMGTNHDLDRCGCEQCVRTRKAMIETGYPVYEPDPGEGGR